MRRLLAPSSVLLVACSSAPHAPPAPIEDPAVVASPSAAPIAVASEVAVVDPARADPFVAASEPLRGEVVPGLERLERVGSLAGGARCGTRIGKAPVCIGDTRTGPTSFEALEPVKRIEDLGGAHCVLFESGKLGCDVTSRATGAKTQVASTGVDDFVIGPTDEIYALSRGGNVVLHEGRGDGTLRTKIVLRGASEIASALSGVCARTFKGGVECTDVDDPVGHATHSVAGMDDVVEVELGGVVRKKDKSLFVLGEDKADPYHAVRVEQQEGGGARALDFAWAPSPCLVTVEGAVLCVDFTKTSTVAKLVTQQVSLPRNAVKLRPRGAPCAELDDGTVACWGSDLPSLRRLGLRVLAASPGSVAPRP
jgi:hypothetical protein